MSNYDSSIKMPKTKAEFIQRMEQAYSDGVNTGIGLTKRNIDAESKNQIAKARMDALKVLTAYVSSSGQTVEAFAKAMQGQL